MNILKKMKEYVEILLFGIRSITDDEVLSQILDGLDSDYDLVVVSLNSRIESKYDKPTLQDV